MEDLKQYREILYPATRVFLGWIYSSDVMKKGYLEDDDYSAWLDDDNMTLTVIVIGRQCYSGLN